MWRKRIAFACSEVTRNWSLRRRLRRRCTGWPFTLCKTSRWLQSKSSGQNGTFVLKSTGSFAQREWSPCSVSVFESRPRSLRASRRVGEHPTTTSNMSAKNWTSSVENELEFGMLAKFGVRLQTIWFYCLRIWPCPTMVTWFTKCHAHSGGLPSLSLARSRTSDSQAIYWFSL